MKLSVDSEIANYTAVAGFVGFQPGALNDGYVMDIRAVADESATVMEIELYEPMGYSINVGDPVHVNAGCDKTLNACQNTYFNVINFRGYPHIPGFASMLNNYG